VSDLIPGTPAPVPSPEPAAEPRGRRLHRRAKPPRRHWIKRRWLRRLVIASTTLVVLIAAVTVSGYAYVDHLYHEATIIKVKHLVPVQTTGPHANAETILLIGSTSRCALNGKQASSFGSCSGPPSATTGITGVNSDVIMLLHTDPNTHRVSILSIPRDLVLYNVRDENFHKVDAALATDPSQLIQVIEQDFGIPINHYVELNFDTFQNVVNTLGGVKVYFPDRVYDAESGLNITTTGCQPLNGFQALALVRARHMNYWVNGVEEYDGSGDLGRIVRDHEFLRILAATVASRGIDNPFQDNDLLKEILPDLTIDNTFSLGEMVDMILDFHAINPNTSPETTMPNIEDHADYMYEGYDYGSVVFPSYPQDEQAIDAWLGNARPPAAAVSPSSFSLSVVDGTGDPATVTTTATALGNLGFHVVESSGSWPSVGPLSETIVEYTPGHLADAQRVAQSLSGIVTMAQAPTSVIAGSDLPESTGADVTLITGTNFSVLPAVATTSIASTSTTSPSRSATTTTNVTTSSAPPPAANAGGSSSATALLGPVSSSGDPAPPYDPRACPAN
jgi:LCP family protein required for cell wall assembly